MKVVFLKKFSKDLDKCPTKVKKRLATIVVQLENTASRDDMPNCKALKGYNNAYRITLGDYRLVGLLR